MPGIFLSYARDDDEPFTRRVYEQLHADGYDVWFDREAMPSRALTFLQEIRDAVRSRDRLIVVLGPRAARSDYVRAEWQAALVDGKVVTPVLRLGDYDLVPAELKNLHCPDVRSGRPEQEAVGELLRILRDPVPPLAALRGPVLEMPAHFQPRPDDLSAMAGTLLYDIEHPAVIDGPQRTTVLHGMGGVGKSVLAAAFARSYTARRVFGDGIIWVSATPTMPALEIVRSVLLLNGTPLHADAGLPEAVTALRAWLDQRRCLIVVDNAWQVEQIVPIAQALSTVSRLLLTTRDAGIATALGANTRPLGVLTPEEALRQLADWVNAAVDELPPDAVAVARETGYLPFALSLQGALARDGVPWADLLHALRHAELDFAEQRFPDYPYPHVLAALRVSVDVLRAEDADAAARFVELSAFFWDEGVPEAAVTRLWAHGPQGIAEHRGRKLLVTLERKALLRLEGVAPQRRVRLHDLMIDFLVAYGDVAVLGGKLIEAYRAACATDWPDGPDDGYFLEHLIDHLARLQDDGAELRRMLAIEDARGHHAWCKTVEAAGRVDRYRQQLQRRVADPATSASEAMRFALMLASLTARAANMPAPLLDALITKGVWPLPRALDYARQLPLSGRRGYASDAGMRMRALLAVATHLPEPDRRGVVDEALSAARDAEDSTPGLPDLAGALAAGGRIADALTVARRASRGDARTSALGAVAIHAAPAEREGIIDEAIADAATTLDVFRAAALEPLLPLLDATGVAKARAAAVEPLVNPIARGWCDAPLAIRLAALGLVEDALLLANSIEDEVSRAEALAGLVPHLADDARDTAIETVLQTAGAIDEDRWRSNIAQAFEDLPDPLASVVPVIFADRSWRPEALRTIAPYLVGAQVGTAAGLVRDSNDPRFAADSAAAIAAVLSDAEGTGLLDHVLPAVLAIDPADAKARGVASIAPMLDMPRRTLLVEETLNALAPVEESIRVKALIALAPVVTPQLVPRVLDLIRPIAAVDEKIGVIEAIVLVLDAAQIPAARATIEMVGDGEEMLLAGAALAAHAGSEHHRAIIRSAAEHGDYLRARALALVAPHLGADLLDEATALLTTIGDPGSLAEIALPAFARRCEEPRRTELLRLAVHTAASITDAERLAWAFEAFRDQLTPELLDEALQAFAVAEASFDPDWRTFGRARYLVAALPHLPPGRRTAVHDEVLALIAALPEAGLRRDVLSLLAANGDAARFEGVVELVEAETDPYERAMTAGFVIDRAPDALRDRLVAAALDEFDQITATDSASVAERVEQAGARVMAYTHDPRYALGVVARFQSEAWKRPALLQFAKAMRADLFDEVLAAAIALEGTGDRAQVLTSLAPAAPAERRLAVLGDALAAAMLDDSDLMHDEVLPELARALLQLSPDAVRALWRDQRSRCSELARPQLLRKLHGLAPALRHADPAIAEVTAGAMSDVRRWWP